MKKDKNPISDIQKILHNAASIETPNPWAMTLSTVNLQGHPTSRTVLLKHLDEQGFVFFTNSNSQKGQHLYRTPFASLTFYFPNLQKQIHIEGSVIRLPSEQSDKYWVTRPRESQIGAWASKQSQPIPDSESLQEAYNRIEQQYPTDSQIPRPSFWNGYRVIPDRIEIWQEGPHRLHRRTLYEKKNAQWIAAKLFP